MKGIEMKRVSTSVVKMTHNGQYDLCFVEQNGSPDDFEWWYDKDTKSLWLVMDIKPRQCYTIDYLRKANAAEAQLNNDYWSGNIVNNDGETFPVWHYITSSRTPGVFNFGGDLDYFRQAITNKDPSMLLAYGEQCMYPIIRRHTGFNNKLITWAFVEGDALGGGFETALACDNIVATTNSRFGCPESRFGFYPGMGAYAFLSRSVGRRLAEEIITSGQTYTATTLQYMGGIRDIADSNNEMMMLLAIANRNIVTSRGISYMWKQANPVTQDELNNVVRKWAHDAMDLSSRNLRLMEKIVTHQLKEK
jgi:DSF synthase